jgi:hypothetical protein
MSREGLPEPLEGAAGQAPLQALEERSFLEAHVVVEQLSELAARRAQLGPRLEAFAQSLREALDLPVLGPDPGGLLGGDGVRRLQDHLLLVGEVTLELARGEVEKGTGAARRDARIGGLLRPAQLQGVDQRGVVVAGQLDQGRVALEAVRPRKGRWHVSAGH